VVYRNVDGARLTLTTVAHSMAGVPRQDQQLTGARGQRKDETAFVCIGKCCSEMVDASIWLGAGGRQPALTANDRSKLLSLRRTKISGLDPPLMSV
jgi:hypothetical protein